jgi:thioredoxin-related protein
MSTNTWSQRLESLANLAIIVVAIALVVVLAQKFILSGQPSALLPTIAVGSKVQLKDASWGSHQKNLLMVLQSGCRYCTESATFYKRLTQEAAGKGVKVVAVLPQTVEEGNQYLQKLGVQANEVRQGSLDDLQVSGTPTLIMVNNQGEVVNSWVGLLPPDKETEVLASL